MGIKLFIVDDNAPFRDTLREFVKNELNCQIVGEASNGNEALKDSRIPMADIVVMNIMMKEMNGIRAAMKLHWEQPLLKILAVTSFPSAITLNQIIQAGVMGLISKEHLFDEMEPALTDIMGGKHFFSKGITN